MKKVNLLISLLFSVQFSFPQTKEDCSSVLNTLKEAFNAKIADQIFNLFSSDLQFKFIKIKTQ